MFAFSSLIAIEVLAVRQYASGWWPALTQAGGDSPTVLGWFMQLLLFVVFFLLNYWSIGVFAKSNTIVTWFNDEHRHSALKFVTPAQRHAGQDHAILAARDRLYRRARQARPERWPGATRD